MKNDERKSAILMDRVARYLMQHGITISAMESCTGGLFSSLLTNTEGASDIFSGSFVTYSNEAKVRCGVPEEVICRYGVYSAETAEAMAEAARAAYDADIGVGITGTIGDADPANADSVPGEVYYSICWGDGAQSGKLVLLPDGSPRSERKERIVAEVAEALGTLLGLPDCEK